MKKFMILGLVALITFSCGDFLEERSQDLVYASSCEDLNEILIGNAYMDNDIGVQYFLYSSSGNYYPWLWVMDDDMEAYTNVGAATSWILSMERIPVCSLRESPG